MIDKRETINYLLVDLFNHILRIEEESLKNAGIKLSMTEVHVLEAIKNSDSKTMTSVASRLKVTLGTLTTSVNGLIRKGYVLKNQNEEDKRIYNLSLTNSGEKVMEIHDKFHDEMITSILDDLLTEEDDVLINSLENISNFFKKRDKN